MDELFKVTLAYAVYSKVVPSCSLLGLDILSWLQSFKKSAVFSSFLGEAENWEVKTEAGERRASHCALVNTKRVASLDAG